MTDAELAWVAGFMEGEGSFTWHTTAAVLAAGQVQRWPLEKLQGLLDGVIHEKKRRNQPSWYQWRLAGVRAVNLLLLLYPHMSPRRQEQMRAVWEKWSALKPDFHLRMRCKYGHPYDEANTKITKSGGRACRACQPMYWKRYEAKRKARRDARNPAGLSGRGPAVSE